MQQSKRWLLGLMVAVIVVGGIAGRAAQVEAVASGACCISDGTCIDLIPTENCTALGGVYQGDFTACTTITCPITNQPPDCSGSVADLATIWPPNHQFVPIGIQGVTDPDGDPITITIVSVFQDEPPIDTTDIGAGDTWPDAMLNLVAHIRSERAGTGDGRVYTISFTADDGVGTCPGTVTVCVPRDRSDECVDQGATYNSTESNTPG